MTTNNPADSANARRTEPAAPHAEVTIPVAREFVEVRKEVVEGAHVRLAKSVSANDQIVDTVLTHDEVDVQRVPINVYVEAPPPVRYEGDTTIIPVLREVAVVYKRLLVVEEVRITRRHVQAVDRQQVPVRSEHVTVERVEPGSK